MMSKNKNIFYEQKKIYKEIVKLSNLSEGKHNRQNTKQTSDQNLSWLAMMLAASDLSKIVDLKEANFFFCFLL